jgi:hypothetical protein
MSIVCLSYVMKHSEARLGPRLTLIALAEFAHDDGTKAFPSIETLVERTRLSRSGVKSALKSLREDGSIEETGKTRSGTIVYTVNMGGQNPTGSESDPGQNPTSGGSNSDPDPSVEPSSLEEGAREVAKLKIGGNPVNPERWQTTCAVLALFNTYALKKLRAVTSAGEPSEAAKRIYGRVGKYPDITLEEHKDIIQRTLKSKWWGEGEPSVGVVYGPRVFEDNITRGLSSRAARDPNRFKRTRSVEED